MLNLIDKLQEIDTTQDRMDILRRGAFWVHWANSLSLGETEIVTMIIEGAQEEGVDIHRYLIEHPELIDEQRDSFLINGTPGMVPMHEVEKIAIEHFVVKSLYRRYLDYLYSKS
jgi:hypothetical protein